MMFGGGLRAEYVVEGLSCRPLFESFLSSRFAMKILHLDKVEV